MLDFFYIFLYIVFPISIVLLARRFDLNLFRVTIPSLVILAMFIYVYIGNLPLYFGWNEYRYASGVQDKTIIFQIFIFTSWSIFSLIAGFIFSKNFLKLETDISLSSSIRILTKSEKILICILFFCCLIVTCIFLMKIPQLAIWVAITEGAKKAAYARSKMGNDFAGKYHWYHLMMYHTLNLITFTFFANWLLLKKKSSFLLFILSFLCITFTSLMATEKSPFMVLVVGLFLTYLIVKKDGKLPLLAILKLSTLLLIPLILLYIYFMGSADPISAIFSIFSRTFTGQIHAAYHYIEFFPTYHDFLWGASFPNPQNLLPFKQFRLTVEIMNWRYPTLATRGIVGSMPTVFWGELYANFGTLGVLILPFFVGIGVYFVSYLTKKLENTPLKVGFYVWLILHYINLAVSGISGFIVDSYLIMISFFVLFIIFISGLFKKFNSPYVK